MLFLWDHPPLVFAAGVISFWIAAAIGSRFQRSIRFEAILAGVMTLLALVIGFTFSMAVSRYDQRKNYEEQEANAIETEYLRASLLPAPDAAHVQVLLKRYLDQRIVNYMTRNNVQLQQINAETARLQADMWAIVQANAQVRPTPVASLIAAGMNDVLNSQGYAQAAWRNRIPIAAWILMIVLGIFCNFLIGYGAYGRNTLLSLTLPIVLSISLFLIADIDSPRGGAIRVYPLNLQSVVESLQTNNGMLRPTIQEGLSARQRMKITIPRARLVKKLAWFSSLGFRSTKPGRKSTNRLISLRGQFDSVVVPRRGLRNAGSVELWRADLARSSFCWQPAMGTYVENRA